MTPVSIPNATPTDPFPFFQTIDPVPDGMEVDAIQSRLMDHLHWVLVQIGNDKNGNKNEGSGDNEDRNTNNNNNSGRLGRGDHCHEDDTLSPSTSPPSSTSSPPPHLVWWPCTIFDDYGPFQRYHATEMDRTMDEMARHKLKCQMSVRIMQNMYHGRRVWIARLLGRPLLDHIQIEASPADGGSGHQNHPMLRPHLGMSQATYLHQMDPKNWFEHKTGQRRSDDQVDKHNDSADAKDALQEVVYLSYMKGLDELHRIVHETTVSAAVTSIGATPPHLATAFYDKGRDLLKAYYENDDDGDDGIDRCPATVIPAAATAGGDEPPASDHDEVEGMAQGASTYAVMETNDYHEEHHDEVDRTTGGKAATSKRCRDRANDAGLSSTSTVVSEGSSSHEAGTSKSSHASVDGDETSTTRVVETTRDASNGKENNDDEDPRIDPNDTFEQAWFKLQFVGWDRLRNEDDEDEDGNDAPELYYKPRWLRRSDDSTNRGQDCFDEVELAEYMNVTYGWVGPDGDRRGGAEDGRPRKARVGRMEVGRDESKKSIRCNMEEIEPARSGGGTEAGKLTVHRTPERTKRNVTRSNSAGRKKVKTAETVVTPASSRQSSRQRKRAAIFSEERNQRQLGTPSIKRPTPVELVGRDAFYHFKNLMDILTTCGGWKYARPTERRGYKLGSTFNTYVYEIPNARAEVDGGEHLVDFFFTEQEVIDHCKRHQYYERRHELGLEWKESVGPSPSDLAAFCTP